MYINIYINAPQKCSKHALILHFTIWIDSDLICEKFCKDTGQLCPSLPRTFWGTKILKTRAHYMTWHMKWIYVDVWEILRRCRIVGSRSTKNLPRGRNTFSSTITNVFMCVCFVCVCVCYACVVCVCVPAMCGCYVWHVVCGCFIHIWHKCVNIHTYTAHIRCVRNLCTHIYTLSLWSRMCT